jgi:nucleotide-binding universal stress UspA family protein
MLKLAPLHPNYHIQGGVHDVEQAIQNFIESNDIDWVVMIPRKHSFFQGLFHRSHTRAVANHTSIPIMALPDAGDH